MMATAISAGVTEPISRPIGEWMRPDVVVGETALGFEPLDAAGVGFP